MPGTASMAAVLPGVPARNPTSHCTVCPSALMKRAVVR